MIIPIVAGAVVLVAFILIAVLSYIAFAAFLKSNPAKREKGWQNFAAKAESGKLPEKWAKWMERYKAEREFFFNTDGYEKLEIKSGKHKLVGHYIGQKSKNTVIILHGLGEFQRGELCVVDARLFYEMGYNVFIPDIGGHGESSAPYLDAGHGKQNYIMLWIETLEAKESGMRFLLCGASGGGAAALIVSGHPDRPASVDAIISDSTYTSLAELCPHVLVKMLKFKWLAKIVSVGVECWCKILARYGFSKNSPIKSVKRSVLPTLIIHGTADNFVPYSMGEKLFENCTAKNKAFLAIEGGGHDDCNHRWSNPQFEEKVKKFCEDLYSKNS